MEKWKRISLMIPRHVDTTFCTKSSYSGKWNKLGMTVYGKYVFPYGCEYEGGFQDGQFHGEGTLTYPAGQKLEGRWDNGTLIACKFTNADGLEQSEKWTYCQMPDRRFSVSIREGLQPAGREFMTNQQPERPIQQGCYDLGDGYYNAVTRTVTLPRNVQECSDVESEESISFTEKYKGKFFPESCTIVDEDRHQWIINNCRKYWDETAGYRPDFYEDWITGRKSELKELASKCQSSSDSPETFYEKGKAVSSAGLASTDLNLNYNGYFGTGRKLSILPSDCNILDD